MADPTGTSASPPLSLALSMSLKDGKVGSKIIAFCGPNFSRIRHVELDYRAPSKDSRISLDTDTICGVRCIHSIAKSLGYLRRDIHSEDIHSVFDVVTVEGSVSKHGKCHSDLGKGILLSDSSAATGAA